ncbi:hypothetical protein ACFL4Q_01495 [candidate division KSB1 bacterium]
MINSEHTVDSTVSYFFFQEEKMILHSKSPFSFNGKDYETRVYNNDTQVNIVVFSNGYPLNGFRHQIKVPKNISVNELLKREVVGELIEISKHDIHEKRWERLTTPGE